MEESSASENFCKFPAVISRFYKRTPTLDIGRSNILCLKKLTMCK